MMMVCHHLDPKVPEDIAFADSTGHTFYAITDGSYLLQTEDGAEIRGEAYMIRDGRIEQICADGKRLTF